MAAKRSDVGRALTRGARGIRRVVKRVPGQPGVTMLQPGPMEGKRGIRRLIKRDPADGLSMPEADRITATHTDLGGAAGGGVTRVVQGSAFNQPTGSGVRTIRPPRKGRIIKR